MGVDLPHFLCGCERESPKFLLNPVWKTVDDVIHEEADACIMCLASSSQTQILCTYSDRCGLTRMQENDVGAASHLTQRAPLTRPSLNGNRSWRNLCPVLNIEVHFV
jgi:hypothetical protein